MKRIIALVLACALTFFCASVALAQEGEYRVSSVDDILAALKQSDCSAMLFQDDPAGEGGAELVIDRMIAIDRPLRVVANRGFTSVRIVEGGALLLAEGAVLGARSTIDFENGIFAIGHFWVDGGMLGAKQGAIEPYTTFYVTGGENMTLPEGDWEGVAVIGAARNEAELAEYLADARYTDVFVQVDLTLTHDVTVNKYLRVSDGVTLTVDGCALTVAEGAMLEVYNGCGIENKGTVVNNGEIHLEAEATYSGDTPEGPGSYAHD